MFWACMQLHCTAMQHLFLLESLAYGSSDRQAAAWLSLSRPCSCTGSYAPQAATDAAWQQATVEQWQAYALQQGWGLGYLEAYYSQYGAWTGAAATAYTQVSSADFIRFPASLANKVSRQAPSGMVLKASWHAVDLAHSTLLSICVAYMGT